MSGKSTIIKAKAVNDPNKYIWIRRNNGLITDKNVKLEVYSKDNGIAYYWKESKDKILVWRFSKSKGWTEETAKLYTLAFKPTPEQVEEAYKMISEWDGHSTLLKSETRKQVYDLLKKHKEDLPDLVNQIIYKNSKKMKEKMQLLVELSNKKFHEFIEESQKVRPNIVKSAELLSKTKEKGFKFHGVVKAFKTIVKDEEGNEKESWRLKTTFTSNKGDLHWDVTSKDAIKSAVAKLKGKVIPIRFEHESIDYGVWDTFKTYTKDKVLYGEAEGELYQDYARSKDLWHDIYELGKEFATSYGGHWIEFHWYQDEEKNEVVRVFDDIEIEEISLTTRPANPDTALEVLNKYAGQLENTLDDNEIRNFISKNNTMTKEEKKLLAELLAKQKAEEEAKKNSEEQDSDSEEETDESSDSDSGDSDSEEGADESTETDSDGDKGEGEEDKEEEDKTEEKSSKSNDKEIAKTLTSIAKGVETLSKELKNISKRVATLEDAPEKGATMAKSDESEADEEETKEEDVEKAVKAKYPWVYSVAKATGALKKDE